MVIFHFTIFLFSLSSSSKSVPVTQYEAAAVVASVNSAIRTTKVCCSNFIDFKVLLDFVCLSQ